MSTSSECISRLGDQVSLPANMAALLPVVAETRACRSVDDNPAQGLCVRAQRFYEAMAFHTQVLPASLTSTTEIMELAGAHHITIAPGLLHELASTAASTNTAASLFDLEADAVDAAPFVSYKDDEKAYSAAFAGSNGGDGEGERKLVQVRRWNACLASADLDIWSNGGRLTGVETGHPHLS